MYTVYQDETCVIYEIEEMVQYAIPSRSEQDIYRNITIGVWENVYTFSCDCNYGFWGGRKTECWHIKKFKKIFPKLLERQHSTE